MVPRQVALGLISCGAVVLAAPVFAQNGMLEVFSSDNGRGLYTYTFTNGASEYFWGISPSSQGIYLQSYGVIQTIQPSGWAATVSPSGLVNWQVTNGTFYFNQGVTLSVLSSYAVPRNYDGKSGNSFFSPGTLLGEVYTNDTILSLQGGGSSTFAYVGPNTNSAPTLACNWTTNGIVIGWPVAAAGYTLQSNPDPSQTNNWVTVTNVPTVVNHSNFVTIPFSTGAQFFRVVNTTGG